MISDITVGTGQAQSQYMGLGLVLSWLSGDSPGDTSQYSAGRVLVQGHYRGVVTIESAYEGTVRIQPAYAGEVEINP